MANYSFKKESRCYLVNLDTGTGDVDLLEFPVGDISFVQTFTEKSYPKKGILAQNRTYEGSVINKANPAIFSFNLYVMDDASQYLDTLWPFVYRTSFDTTYSNSFLSVDILVVTEQDTFRIKNCAFTECVFEINRLQPLSVSLSGQAVKIDRLGDGAWVDTATKYPITNSVLDDLDISNKVPIPSTRTFRVARGINVVLGSKNISSNIQSMNLQLSNDIKWTPYTSVLQGASSVDAATSMYPNHYTTSKQVLSGTIERYIATGDNPDFQDWSSNTTIFIAIEGQTLLDTTNIAFTNRLTANQIFLESYDWRATETDAHTNIQL